MRGRVDSQGEVFHTFHIDDVVPASHPLRSTKQRVDRNVLSGVRLSRAYLPDMKQRNWGRIVFISSESAINTPAEMIHYGMTKAAQLAVSRGLAQSCAGTDVTVNAVLPGPTRSPGVEEFAAQLSGGKPFAEFETE